MKTEQLTVTKLSLAPGDVLAVMVPTMLSRPQHEAMMKHLAGQLPLGVRPMIFDGGITIAQLTADVKG